MISMQIDKMVRLVLLIITGALVVGGTTVAEIGTDLTHSASYNLTGDVNVADIPVLVGLWKTESVGTTLLKSTDSNEFSHHLEGLSTLTGVVNITKQDGRVLYGTFAGSRGKDEKMIGVIDFDNNHLRFTDMDGIMDLDIIDNTTMHMLYSHVTDADTVVAVGTWTRVADTSSA